MRYSPLLLTLTLLTTLGCNSPGELQQAPVVEPVQAPVVPKEVLPAPAAKPVEAVQKEAKQSYSVCLEYCVMVMDQAGQVTDECPKECRKNPDTFTEADLHTDDQDAGLIAFPDCLTGCLETPGGTKKGAECKQSCCVESCVIRQEYKGSGMGTKCPAMCREFLERTAGQAR